MNSSPSPNRDASFDCCAWARKLNASWIVRGGLDRAAEDYMRHLEASDLARLERSCHNARSLVDLRDPSEDPKPWFYAGLFSLATPDEADRFAGQHWLTYATVSSNPAPCQAGNSPATIEKLRLIRDALSRFRSDSPPNPT